MDGFLAIGHGNVFEVILYTLCPRLGTGYFCKIPWGLSLGNDTIRT